MKGEISRRDFVKGSVAGTIGFAAAGLLCSSGVAARGAAQDSQQEEPDKPEQADWNAEYDVVVLGYGGAGANAAVSAYENNASVLLADKAPRGLEGGNTRFSSQLVMATDDPEQLYIYLTDLMGESPNRDDEAIRAFCEGCAENYSWMTGPMGGNPDLICPRRHPAAVMENLPAVRNGWQVWENPWGIGRRGYVYCPQEDTEYEPGRHCLYLTATGTRYDGGCYNLCQAAVEAREGRGIDVWSAAAGRKLLTGKDGEVTGVLIEKDGQKLRVKARGGVVLATGGFEHNPVMLAGYLQQPCICQSGGLFNDGDGITMAMGVGADLWHMSGSTGYGWTCGNMRACAPGLVRPAVTMGIIVGPGGTRYMNEAEETSHGRPGAFSQVPPPSFMIHDSAALTERRQCGAFSAYYREEIARGEVLTGNTLEELAEAVRRSGGGMDAPYFSTQAFLSTVDSYNKKYAAGEDADYGRPLATMKPVRTGPFYAVKIRPVICGTLGGPRRNVCGQVIHADGHPIDGLFSAGELGSIFFDMCGGHGTLAEAMISGRISGKNAALRAGGKSGGKAEPFPCH